MIEVDIGTPHGQSVDIGTPHGHSGAWQVAG